jgi:hypothetical protein
LCAPQSICGSSRRGFCASLCCLPLLAGPAAGTTSCPQVSTAVTAEDLHHEL